MKQAALDGQRPDVVWRAPPRLSRLVVENVEAVMFVVPAPKIAPPPKAVVLPSNVLDKIVTVP